MRFARTPSGSSLTVDIDELEHIGELRAAIQSRLKFWTSFRLFFKGKNLDDQKTLRDYNITPGCTIFVLGRLRGGPVTINPLPKSLTRHQKVGSLNHNSFLKKSKLAMRIFPDKKNGL